MEAGMGLTGSKRLSGMSAAPPATISTTMVSPMTRLKPSITPVAIPEKAAGIVTVVSVSQCVAPSAKEDSLRLLGTERRASSEMVQIVGTAMRASRMAAFNIFSPVGAPK